MTSIYYPKEHDFEHNSFAQPDLPFHAIVPKSAIILET